MRTAGKFLAVTSCLFVGAYGVRDVGAESGEASATPSGMQVSIREITMASSEGRDQKLYECDGETEEDCLVDMMSQTELDALAQKASESPIDPGSYDRVALNTCRRDSNGATLAPAFLSAEFEVLDASGGGAGGAGLTTFFTDSDETNQSGLKTTGPAEFAAVPGWTCAERLVLLPEPVEVTAGGEVDLTVVFDGRFIAWTTQTDDGQAFQVSYPAMMAFAGSGQPQVKGFLIAHAPDVASLLDEKANAYVSVFLDPDGTPVMASARPYFSDTAAAETQATIDDEVYGGPGYLGETPPENFSVNGDGTIEFVVGDPQNDNGAHFEAFRLEEHTGTVEGSQSGTWSYHAIPVDD